MPSTVQAVATKSGVAFANVVTLAVHQFVAKEHLQVSGDERESSVRHLRLSTDQSLSDDCSDR